MVEKGILLGLIEPVDFIHKQDRLFAVKALLLSSLLNHRPNLLDTGQHRRELNKMAAGFGRQYSGKGCFAATGRPP